MAEKRRFLDLWITDTNTVYKEVPFAVVTDWIQQGRLLPDDKAKPSGTPKWYRLADIPAHVLVTTTRGRTKAVIRRAVVIGAVGIATAAGILAVCIGRPGRAPLSFPT